MLRRVAGTPMAAVVLSAALLVLLAHASLTDALSDQVEQGQEPRVAKELNDLLAWSIGELRNAKKVILLGRQRNYRICKGSLSIQWTVGYRKPLALTPML